MERTGIDERLQLGDHVCALIEGIDDGLDVMAQTVTAGLAGGDMVMVFTESLPPVAVLAGLEERGVAMTPAQRSGQVRVLPAREAYLPTGRFEPFRVLDSMAGHIEQATTAGFSGLRMIGDMTWALGAPPGVEQLARYEAHSNELYMQGRALGICLYDQSAFGSELLRDVACAHPTTTSPSDDTDGAPLLRIRRTLNPYGLRLTGEADLTNRQALAAALDALVDQRPDNLTPVVIDVEGLRFADAGAAVLLGGLALKAPGGVCVTAAQGTVETVFDRLGVTRLSQMHLSTPTGTVSGDAEGVGTEMVA